MIFAFFLLNEVDCYITDYIIDFFLWTGYSKTTKLLMIQHSKLPLIKKIMRVLIGFKMEHLPVSACDQSIIRTKCHRFIIMVLIA